MAELSLRTERLGDDMVVTDGGDLDYDSQGRLEDALDAAVGALDPAPDGLASLVLDLTEVTYCDSGGLRVLVSAARRADDVGARFAVRGAHGQPARALRLIGVAEVPG